MPEIKDCPHCANSEHVKCENELGSWFMNCHLCGMNGPRRFNENDAVEDWNALPRKEESAIRIDDISDHITNPNYYSCWEIEPWDFIMDNNLGFAEGCIIKYIMRYKMKDGLRDLVKARSYLDELIKKMEKGKNG